MDLLLCCFTAIYELYFPPPSRTQAPHNAKSTIFTKKEKLFSSALHEFHYNLLVSGGFSSPLFIKALLLLLFACIKAQKIMVYLLVNTSIKVCSFFFLLPERCRFFRVCFFNFLLTFFSFFCCCCCSYVGIFFVFAKDSFS